MAGIINADEVSHPIQVVLEPILDFFANRHLLFRVTCSTITARTSTRLSKNVAPPPMSVKAEDVVLLTLAPPGESLFQ